MPMSGCPDPSVLDAVVRGTLTEPPRADVLSHLASCSRCRDALDRLQGATQDLPPANDTPPADRLAPDTSVSVVPVAPNDLAALHYLDTPGQPGSLGRLGPYEILGILGEGSVGVVLRGYEPALRREVAIKVLAPQLVGNPAARRRFAREGRATAALSHPNIVAVHAVEEKGARPYLVMEYIPGESLQQRLNRDGSLPLPEAVRIAVGVAQALAAAHTAGLVHRDVKPGNVLIEAGTGRVKLTDFGLVQQDDADVSQADVLAGTPLYMSPEQAEGRPINARSDLFSLGSVLYAMCSGRPPFAGSSPLAVLRRISDASCVPLRRANPAVPAWLSFLVTRLHSKDAAARPDAAEVARILQERQGDPALKRRPRPFLRALAVLLVLGVGLAVAEYMDVRGRGLPWLRNQGKLIVHNDDEKATIRIAGRDGELDGAGTSQWSLPAGEYLLVTTRPGRARVEEAVTIGRGGIEVFRVERLAEQTGSGPFILLGGTGKERAFPTLVEAIEKVRGGSTIEVRGDGPFVVPPLKVARPLTIRAGVGFAPVIRHDGNDPLASLITTTRPLILEGLTLEAPGTKVGILTRLVHAQQGAPLGVAGCRLQIQGNGAVIVADSATVVEVRRSLLLRGDTHHGMVEMYSWAPGGRLLVDGCVLADNDMGILLLGNLPVGAPCRVVVRQSTLIASRCIVMWKNVPWGKQAPDRPVIQIEVSDSILKGSRAILQFNQPPNENEKPLDTAAATQLLRKVMTYRDRGNYYSTPAGLLSLSSRFVTIPGGHSKVTLREWWDFWGQPAVADSSLGRVEFRGGDVVERAVKDAGTILVQDVGLAVNSPGKGSTKEGKDFGADVNLLGPGPGLERWRQTEDYQNWRREAERILTRGQHTQDKP